MISDEAKLKVVESTAERLLFMYNGLKESNTTIAAIAFGEYRVMLSIADDYRKKMKLPSMQDVSDIINNSKLQ